MLAGQFGTSEAALGRAGGANVNLWTGVALLVVSTSFVLWARLRPVVVPADRDDD